MPPVLEISHDGGSAEAVQDFALPSSGSDVLRYVVKSVGSGSRLQAKISDSGTDDYGIRAVAIYGETLPERTTLGEDVSYEAILRPRPVSQETQPTPAAGELLAWYQPSTGRVWLVYNDATAGVVAAEFA